MTIIITITVIALFIYIFSNKQTLKHGESNVTGTTLGNQKTIQSFSDNSIIDVTDQSVAIPPVSMEVFSAGVPQWSHHYVYSHQELNYATEEQKRFYGIFKSNFLKGKYYDLEGNTNYAFILLFDLLNDYDQDQDKNIAKLENKLLLLGDHYPRTKSYGLSFLLQRVQASGDINDVIRIQSEYQQYSYNSDSYKLGNKYKSKLGLSDEDVRLLNKLWYPTNSFCRNEFCLTQIISLFLSTIKNLKEQLLAEGTTIDEQFSIVADVIARKFQRYKKGSSNYNYCIQSTPTEFYLNIFKRAENVVREAYKNKRKINTEITYKNSEILLEYQNRIISRTDTTLQQLASTISPPDEATEVELNKKNPSRWKMVLDELVRSYEPQNEKQFVNDVLELRRLNENNISDTSLLYDAFKCMIKPDKKVALILYIHYLHHNINITSLVEKSLSKVLQKSLFQTDKQKKEFDLIITELINDKNLEKSVQAASHIYEIKRKKILLDEVSIKDVQEKHSVTVDLLNKYLQDDEEKGAGDVKQVNTDAIPDSTVHAVPLAENSIYKSDIIFSSTQVEVLEAFVQNNFVLSTEKLAEFARERGAFLNQLIESINDVCYNMLDDVLVQENDTCFTVDQDNYRRILV